MRWLYRLALGQPHQQDFIETVSELPDDAGSSSRCPYRPGRAMMKRQMERPRSLIR